MSDRKYWVFEATHKPDGGFRVGVATEFCVQTFPLNSDGGYPSLVRPSCVERFHDQYTVTSGEVPPWLEKPLPPLVPFRCVTRDDNKPCRAVADDEALSIMTNDGDRRWHWNRGRGDGELMLRVNWRILGSPDLPEWLKTEGPRNEH